MPELAFERAELDARLAIFRGCMRRDGLEGAMRAGVAVTPSIMNGAHP